MEKSEFLPASDNQEHLNRHAYSSSLTISSKALKTTNPETVQKLLENFDAAFQKQVQEKGTLGRTVLAIKTDRWVGTDAVVPAEELREDSIFTIVREPGTRGEAKVKVAIVNPENMPKTNVVHAVYGPYNEKQCGIYTMMFGDPGEPFPKDLPEDADERSIVLNERAKAYWNGVDGKGGHVFLATPSEMENAIRKMKEFGYETEAKLAEIRLKSFLKNPTLPIISHKPSEISKDAIDLGKIYLPPIVSNTNNEYLEK